jgi:hypothetical protein
MWHTRTDSSARRATKGDEGTAGPTKAVKLACRPPPRARPYDEAKPGSTQTEANRLQPRQFMVKLSRSCCCPRRRRCRLRRR